MSARRADFNPNQVTFDEGIDRVRRATEKAGLDVARVVTSRDPEAQVAQKFLAVTNIPGGFTKWQLPVYLQSASQLFISVGQADADVPEHSHDDGDGIRFIVGGSIFYRDQELTTGDWMFIPAGQKYSFKVGPLGAVMCYCYCCCCAGRADFIPDLGYPDPTIDIARDAGQIDIARDAGQIDIARDAGQIDIARDAGQIDIARDAGQIDIARDAGQIDIARDAGQIDIARDAGQIDIARDAGQIDIARRPGNVDKA